ncbi:MAG TPA: DUF4280 domain-containing protein [Acidimicrobiales bacterium]|nr:DUF4280 domain-containing protein [Acidimicrobiales bacterium]
MTAPVITTGTQLMCSFGLAPSVLNALPTPRVMCGTPVATIMDHAPLVNIPPFGMCTSLANPTVAAATAAALGVLTPMPCIPVIPGPWTPMDPTVLVGGNPILLMGSMCNCAYGGVIQPLMGKPNFLA